MAFCPRCGSHVDIPLPVEPLFSLETAAQLVPTTKGALETWLRRHKAEVSPAQYRTWNRQRRRLLTASDIVTIRARLVSTTRYPKKENA